MAGIMRKVNIGDRIYTKDELSGYCLLGVVEYIKPFSVENSIRGAEGIFDDVETIFIVNKSDPIELDISSWNDSVVGYVIDNIEESYY